MEDLRGHLPIPASALMNPLIPDYFPGSINTMVFQDYQKQNRLKNTTGPPASTHPWLKSTEVFLQLPIWMRPIWPRLIHSKTPYTLDSVERKPKYSVARWLSVNPLPMPFLPGLRRMGLLKIMLCPIRPLLVLVSGFRLRLRHRSLLFGGMTGAS